MQRLLLAGVGALSLGVVPAVAADLKAPAPAVAPVASWTGIYAGLSVGARWTDAEWTTTCLAPLAPPGGCPISAGLNTAAFNFPARLATANPSSFDPSGIRVGGYLGYNYQIQNWVIGVEGDLAWADNHETHIGIPGTFLPGAATTDTAKVVDTWDASIRARLGFLVTPTALFYVTGGATWIRKEVTATCGAPFFPVGWCTVGNAQSASKTHFGWTLGGGVEWMFAPNWILRGEYRYSDYESASYTFFAGVPIDSFNFTIEQKTHTAYLGIAYKFGPVAAPLVTK